MTKVSHIFILTNYSLLTSWRLFEGVCDQWWSKKNRYIIKQVCKVDQAWIIGNLYWSEASRYLPRFGGAHTMFVWSIHLNHGHFKIIWHEKWVLNDSRVLRLMWVQISQTPLLGATCLHPWVCIWRAWSNTGNRRDLRSAVLHCSGVSFYSTVELW